MDTGLGIRSLVFHVNRSFFYEQTSETAIRSFPRVISSRHSLKKRVMDQKATGAICSWESNWEKQGKRSKT